MSIPTVDVWNQRINRCSNCFPDDAPLYPDDPPPEHPYLHSCSMPSTAPGIFEAEEKASGIWSTCADADTALASATWDSEPAGVASAEFFSDIGICSKTLLRYRIRIPDSFTGSWVHVTWDELQTSDGGITGTLTPKSWTWTSADPRTSPWSLELLPSGNGEIYLRNGYSQITHGTIYGAKPNRAGGLALWP
jgi:hypothetical protein